MEISATMPPVDDAVRTAMQAVYDQGFAAGDAAGYLRGLKTAQQQIEKLILVPADQQRLPADSPMSELGLSIRARNCLWREGFRTVGDLAAASDNKLLEIRMFGEKARTELDEKLAAAGYVRPKS